MLRTRFWKLTAIASALALAAMAPATAAGGPPDERGGAGGPQMKAGGISIAAPMAPGEGAGGPGGGSGGPPDTPGGGGGKPDNPGGDEGAGNNLSMPVLWSEAGYQLVLRGTMLEPAIADTSATCNTDFGGGDAAQQKLEVNTWQAENELVPGNSVAMINWGDALEATDANSKMQRVEVSLYGDLGSDTMTGYEMCKTNDITGVGELWGAIAAGESITELPTSTPMIYTAGGRLTIQRIVPDRTYTWDAAAHQWVGCGADDPTVNQAIHEKTTDGPGNFGVEVSVSGNIVYGYIWQTGDLPQGEYRLTFSLDGATDTFPGSGTNMASASILVPEEETVEELVAVAAEDEEGGAPGANTAIVRNDLNLTYIDVGLGTRTDDVPTCEPTTPPATGGGTSTPAAPAPAPVAAPAPATVTEQPEATTPEVTPQEAKVLIAQYAKIKAAKSGKYPVGTTIVLAKKPVKTDVGVTVRWRATMKSRDNCLVQVRKGKATATLTDPGRCRVIGWAPAASPDFAPFKVVRTYRVTR